MTLFATRYHLQGLGKQPRPRVREAKKPASPAQPAKR